MKEYFTVNRHKSFFQLFVTAILLSLGWTIYFISRDQVVDTSTIIVGYFATAIILPLFSQIISIGQEVIEFNRISKILNNEPFDQLTKIGFSKTLTDRTSKYLSSNPKLYGTIDNYSVNIEMEKGVVRIIVGADLDLIEKSHMTELKRIFGKDNVEYDVGVALLYKPSRRKDLIFQDLNSELRQLTSFLRTNKIDPWDDNGNA
jgi:hypothetical protein